VGSCSRGPLAALKQQHQSHNPPNSKRRVTAQAVHPAVFQPSDWNHQTTSVSLCCPPLLPDNPSSIALHRQGRRAPRANRRPPRQRAKCRQLGLPPNGLPPGNAQRMNPDALIPQLSNLTSDLTETGASGQQDPANQPPGLIADKGQAELNSREQPPALAVQRNAPPAGPCMDEVGAVVAAPQIRKQAVTFHR
jgi:hypothetical protein